MIFTMGSVFVENILLDKGFFDRRRPMETVDWQTGKISRLHLQKKLKKGLILFDKDAIMCVCMEN